MLTCHNPSIVMEKEIVHTLMEGGRLMKAYLMRVLNIQQRLKTKGSRIPPHQNCNRNNTLSRYQVHWVGQQQCGKKQNHNSYRTKKRDGKDRRENKIEGVVNTLVR